MSNLESPAESLPGPRIQKTKPFFETVEGGQAAPAAREGLPPGYRMRADPHYVDLLASRSSAGRERNSQGVRWSQSRAVARIDADVIFRKIAAPSRGLVLT